MTIFNLPKPLLSSIPKLNSLISDNYKCNFEDVMNPEDFSIILQENSPAKIEWLIQQWKSPLVLENSREDAIKSPHLQIEEIFIQVYIEHTNFRFRSFLGKTKTNFYFEACGLDKNKELSFVVSKNLNILFQDFCKKNLLVHDVALSVYKKTKLEKQLVPKNNTHVNKIKI